MTPARAQEIIRQAIAASPFGPFHADYRKPMTADEVAFVKAVWDTKPGHYSFSRTLESIANATVERAASPE